jgi:hypothetical protein
MSHPYTHTYVYLQCNAMQGFIAAIILINILFLSFYFNFISFNIEAEKNLFCKRPDNEVDQIVSIINMSKKDAVYSYSICQRTQQLIIL